MGRPKNDEPYKKCSFAIAESVYNKFDSYCDENLINKSKMLEKLIKDFIESKEKA